MYIVKLSDDYFIHSPAFVLTALTSVIFASDVPCSWTERSKDIQSIPKDSFIQVLTSMPYLQRLTIRYAAWLSTRHVQAILGSCTKLRDVNFRDSGSFTEDTYFSPPDGFPRRCKDVCWGIKGNVEEIANILAANPKAEVVGQVMDED